MTAWCKTLSRIIGTKCPLQKFQHHLSIWQTLMHLTCFAEQPLLAGAASQPLCSDSLLIYLCLHLQTPAATSCHAAHTAWLWVYIIYLPVHWVGGTNMSPHYNLSPTVKMYRQHRRIRSNRASQRLPTCQPDACLAFHSILKCDCYTEIKLNKNCYINTKLNLSSESSVAPFNHLYNVFKFFYKTGVLYFIK